MCQKSSRIRQSKESEFNVLHFLISHHNARGGSLKVWTSIIRISERSEKISDYYVDFFGFSQPGLGLGLVLVSVLQGLASFSGLGLGLASEKY
jgi:hypothetical protein